MDYKSEQMDKWAGEFGKEYTGRNIIDSLDDSYQRVYGVTRTQMNDEFLSGLSKETKILEVGCNICNQLVLLKQLGFKALYGLELSSYALALAKKRDDTEGISLVHGSAFDIPFKDGFFGMVFTSGVLIHISPSDIKMALSEIYRCSGEYVWGFEYYAEEYKEVTYRKNKDMLWKTDFSKLYMEQYPDLKLVRKKKYFYLEERELEDLMFLLQKQQ